MLNLEHVNKKFHGFSLNDISLHLPKGYIMGLIGPNGSGKTSLIHCIMGLYKLNSGMILVDRLDVAKEENKIKNRIGFVLNEDLFTGEMTLEENMKFYGAYYAEFKEDCCKMYCKRFCIDQSRKLKALSKGEKLKFQFAFALSHNPSLLILDEPTESFDPEFRDEFIKIITEFVKDGERSVLLATHLTDELDKIADYITFINHGELVLSMDKESLYDSYRLISGEDYKVNLISKNYLVWKEKGLYGSKALVHHSKYSNYDKELTVMRPSIEDIMYFIIKGEKKK